MKRLVAALLACASTPSCGGAPVAVATGDSRFETSVLIQSDKVSVWDRGYVATDEIDGPRFQELLRPEVGHDPSGRILVDVSNAVPPEVVSRTVRAVQRAGWRRIFVETHRAAGPVGDVDPGAEVVPFEGEHAMSGAKER